MSVITGDGIRIYRLLVLQGALRLECKGMKMSRGRSVYAVIKKEFGLKGSKQRVLTQFEQYIRCETDGGHGWIWIPKANRYECAMNCGAHLDRME
jgi:hypothetical protein